MRTALFDRKMGWQDGNALERLLQGQLGSPLQLDLLALLYTPSIAHEAVPQNEDEFRIYRIRIAGVVVRYVEESYTVQVTIEGELPTAIVGSLQEDLTRKLALLEQSPMMCGAIA
jgi:hypothetical protein